MVGVGLFFMATSSTTGRSSAIALASAGRNPSAESIADALGPVGAGNLGVVREQIGIAAVTFERRAVGQTEVGQLQAGDGAEGIVVHDDPDDAEAVLHRCGEHCRVLAEATVADQRHHGAVGRGQLGADRGRRTEAHRREPSWRQDGARRADRELLADAVLVPTDVGRDVGIVGQHAARLGQDPLRHHRERRAASPSAQVADGERRPGVFDALDDLGVGEAIRIPLSSDSIENLERSPGVGDGADLGREMPG